MKNKKTFLAIGAILLISFGALLISRSSNRAELAETGVSNTSHETAVTQTSPDTRVTFEDENLENLVRETLLKPEGDIMASEMLEIYDINLKDRDVTDLTGLEHAKKLMSFSAEKSDLKSLEPLANLKNLERLVIKYLTLEDPVLKFAEDVNLSTVLIIETNISDLSFLEGMTNLTSVNVTRSGVTDISPLEGLANLERVSLADNDITDISALAGKKKLTNLNLQSNEDLVSAEPLEDAEALEYLVLSYTGVENLKPLEGLSNLREFRIYKNHDVKHTIFDQVGHFESRGVEMYYHR